MIVTLLIKLKKLDKNIWNFVLLMKMKGFRKCKAIAMMVI